MADEARFGCNPNLRSGVLFFPTTHVIVNLFEKRSLRPSSKNDSALHYARNI
ncbi:hypothetical protein K443DRAFT_13049 [Laccaria amethystina LaAM-08-1]|uniref:Uncharacterized protein n=1 Tax=Laccaria amethystina LaAM-08-1 TaxID=1095629 RepID=A0A0C9X6B7_9AGAR|nr:hypothetical protein K443DRAFT_13049 [Laccaria amethystina LaAM-08-1]